MESIAFNNRCFVYSGLFFCNEWNDTIIGVNRFKQQALRAANKSAEGVAENVSSLLRRLKRGGDFPLQIEI